MKDQFYVVLPSNSSMHYFTDNTTTRYVTQLPQQIRLQGVWNVALTEIQIPLTFQHIPPSQEKERSVRVNRKPYHTLTTTNEIARGEPSFSTSQLRPGIYTSIESLVNEINNLSCVKNHLDLNVERGGYVSARRLCGDNICKNFDHEFIISKKISKILGLEFGSDKQNVIRFHENESIVGDRPANLANGLPSMLMIYSDICEPYVTGDVQTRLLRAVSLDIDEYTYGGMRIKSFSPPMYLPLMFNSFRTIEIDIRDQHGDSIPFD